MSDFFTQEQLDVLDQSIRGKRIKIEILDNRYKVLDSIEGECESGSINEDANSDNRRSFDLNIIVSSQYTNIITSKYIIDKNSYIWLDKYVKVYVGIDDLTTNETIWFNKGIYLIDTPSYNYSLEENRLSITGLDLIGNLTDQRKGQLTNYQTKIEAYYEDAQGVHNTTLREAFVGIIKDFAYIPSYYIAPMKGDLEYLPEDVTFDAGSTIYDMFSKLIKNYLPSWEMYFDEEGIFRIQPIPDGINDVIYPLNEDNTSVEEVAVDFSNVKNLVVVRGRTHNADYFVENTEGQQDKVWQSNNTLYLVVDGLDVSTIENNTTIGFVWLDEYNDILDTININNGTLIMPLLDFEGEASNIVSKKFQPNSIIVIRYRALGNNVSDYYFDFLSNDQAQGFAVNVETGSPYYINAEIKGENYYGGLTICDNHINYEIILNNEDILNDLNLNTQITLMPNILNDDDATLTVIDGVTENTLVSNIPIGNIKNNIFEGITKEKWDGDYTIYKLTYKYDEDVGYYFNLDGRLQTYNYYLSGGEYDNIYSNSLAQQRARYELYLHSNLNDSVDISTVPIYYMGVNKKIQYTERSTGISDYFLTKNISTPLDAAGSIMNINAIRLYPEQYYLTIINSPGCEITVLRNGIRLESGDVIKQDDELIMSVTSSGGYIEPYITINGYPYISGSTYIVKSNIQAESYATAPDEYIVFKGLDSTGHITSIPENIVSYMVGNGSTSYRNGLLRSTPNLEIPEYYNNKPVTRIGFRSINYDDINSIIIPNTVNEIGEECLAYCSGLNSLTIPFVGETIPSGTSANVNTLFGFIFGRGSYPGSTKTSQYYDSGNTYDYYIPNSLKKVTVNGGKVLYGSFSNCNNLTNIILSDNINIVQARTFYNCNNLISVTMPNSIDSRILREEMFRYCSNLVNVNIPNNIDTIYHYVFDNCSSLTNIIIPDSVTIIYEYAFSNTGLISVIIPNNVYFVYGSRGIFQSCYNLQSIIFGDSVTFIPQEICLNCFNLSNVQMSDNVTSIAYDAFRNCYNLKNINLSNNLTSIGIRAFRDTGLESIIIPDTITFIAQSVFLNCNNLKTITVLAINPPQLDDIDAISTATENIYVPNASVNDYKTAVNWSNFENIISGI